MLRALNAVRGRAVLAVAALAALLAPGPGASETLRPLVTEDLATLEGGQMELQLAMERQGGIPNLNTGLDGTLVSAPIAALNLGLSDRLEVQSRLPLHQRFSVGGESSGTLGDLTLGAKLRLVGGGLVPGLGLRGQVKLPAAGGAEGIGSGAADFRGEAIVGVDLAAVTLAGNLGLALLGDPGPSNALRHKVVLGGGVLLPLGLAHVAGDLYTLRGGDPEVPDSWSARAGVAARLGPLRLDGAVGYARTEGNGSLVVTAGVGVTVRVRR